MLDTAGKDLFSEAAKPDQAPLTPAEQAARCAEAARLAMETPPEESQALQARWLANGGRF